MTLTEIRKMQHHYGVLPTQIAIENGSIWKFPGSTGRHAMELIESGICYLGTDVTYDYYGNPIPSRDALEDGTKGTLQRAADFWENVEDGDEEALMYLESYFTPSDDPYPGDDDADLPTIN